MILPIYVYGQPVLRKVAEPVPAEFPELPELVENMFETMYHSNGIGLAAPQIGRSIRLIVIDLDVLSDDLPEYKGFKQAYVNPEILEIDESSPIENAEEGCLSLPGLHEKVARHTRIKIRYEKVEDRTPVEEWIEGYLTRVLQHEIDHLEGRVFTDRISPLRKQLIKSKLRQLTQGKYRASYRTK